jgi:hypothetical protein
MWFYGFRPVAPSTVTAASAAAVQIATQPTYLQTPWHHVAPDDLAVVTFGSDLAPGILSPATDPFADGDAVTLIGYGLTRSYDSATATGALTRRIGNNVLHRADQADAANQPGMIIAFSPPGDDAVDPRSGIAEGDSGSPLLTADGSRLLGVASGGGLARGGQAHCSATTADCSNLWVDLQSAASQTFLATAVTR